MEEKFDREAMEKKLENAAEEFDEKTKKLESQETLLSIARQMLDRLDSLNKTEEETVK